MTPGPSISLEPESIDAIARRVVELMRVDAAPGLVDAVEVAQLLGVSRGYVYDHLPELGAIRVGGRWRFDPDTVARARVSRSPEPDRPAATGPARRVTSRRRRVEPLLPIRGHAGAGAARVGAEIEAQRASS